jgi:hypothetical protein
LTRARPGPRLALIEYTLKEDAMRASSLLMSLSISTVLALGLTACGGSGSNRSDPLTGNWVLNVQKSTYVPGPGPKSQTVVISGTDQARKLVVDVTPDVGSAMHWEVAGAANQDLPVTGVNPNADTYSFRRVNPNTIQAQYKKGGRNTITQTAVVSADGNTMTVTGKGTNVGGQAVNNVAVFDRR